MNVETTLSGIDSVDTLLEALGSRDRAVHRNAVTLGNELIVVLHQQDDPAWLWDAPTQTFWLRAFLYDEFRWRAAED